jgi:hypothetical protein
MKVSSVPLTNSWTERQKSSVAQRCVVLRCVSSYCAVSCRVVLCCAVLCCVELCRVVSCCVAPCSVVSCCCVVLCCVVSCRVVSGCVVLCCVVAYYAQNSNVVIGMSVYNKAKHSNSDDRSQRPRGLTRWSARRSLAGITGSGTWMSVSYKYCVLQVQVYETGRLLVQRSPTECVYVCVSLGVIRRNSNPLHLKRASTRCQINL